MHLNLFESEHFLLANKGFSNRFPFDIPVLSWPAEMSVQPDKTPWCCLSPSHHVMKWELERRRRWNGSGMDMKCENGSLWWFQHQFDFVPSLPPFALHSSQFSKVVLFGKRRRRAQGWVLVWSILSDLNLISCEPARWWGWDSCHLHNVIPVKRSERLDHEEWTLVSHHPTPPLFSHLDKVYCSLILYRFKNQSIFKMKWVESRGVIKWMEGME